MKRLILFATGLLAFVAMTAAPAGAGRRGDVGRGLHRGEPVQQPQRAHRVVDREGLEARRAGPAQRRRLELRLGPRAQRPGGLQRHDPDVHPRDHGRIDRSRHEQSDQAADERAEPLVRRLLRRCEHGHLVRARGRDPHRQRRLVHDERLRRRGGSEVGASPGRPERAQHLHRHGSREPRLRVLPVDPGLPGRQVRDARRRRHPLRLAAGRLHRATSTSASPRRTRSATGSASRTRSTRAATATATASTTRRRCSCRRAAARRGRTPA